MAKAREINIKISAAVSNEGGRLVVFQRMDDPIWASLYASQGKAVAAAEFGRVMGGGCGVSGGTAQQDEDCARAGVAQL